MDGDTRDEAERTLERSLAEIEARVLDGLEGDPESTNLQDLRARVERHVESYAAEHDCAFSRVEASWAIESVLNELRGLGPLDPLLANPEVTAVDVRGPGRVFEERAGQRRLTERRFRDEAHLQEHLERMAASSGAALDEAQAILDFRLRRGPAAGSRVHGILAPVATHGTCLTIRKPPRLLSLRELVLFGTLSREVAEFLAACVEARLNILVTGRPGAGRTVLLNGLCGCIGGDEQIVTVEECLELQLRQDDVTRFELLPPSQTDGRRVGLPELVRGAALLEPDRLVLGDCRGDAALEICRGLSDGQFSGLARCPGDRPRDALYRLADDVLAADPQVTPSAARELVCRAFHLVVAACRFADGRRTVVEVCDVTGMSGDAICLQTVFTYAEAMGRLQPAGVRSRWYDQIQATEHGAMLPRDLFDRREGCGGRY